MVLFNEKTTTAYFYEIEQYVLRRIRNYQKNKLFEIKQSGKNKLNHEIDVLINSRKVRVPFVCKPKYATSRIIIKNIAQKLYASGFTDEIRKEDLIEFVSYQLEFYGSPEFFSLRPREISYRIVEANLLGSYLQIDITDWINIGTQIRHNRDALSSIHQEFYDTVLWIEKSLKTIENEFSIFCTDLRFKAEKELEAKMHSL